MNNPTPAETPSFSRRVVHWQRLHGRHDLPWQGKRDPYRIWLAEIMLQQTQVTSARAYFARFLARFPDVETLAAAPQADVLALWAGLGYYARARNLHACAREVVTKYAGHFPRTARELAALPGIGRSTAAAIAAFANHERAAILDGNVKRVLCRYFAIEGVPAGRVEKTLWALAESLLPQADEMPAYTQGMMDLGALLCTRTKPRCADCPLQADCAARAQGRQEALPTRKTAKAKATRQGEFFCISDGHHLLLERRPAFGIWGGLYCPPETLASLPPPLMTLLAERTPEALPVRAHVFTHFRLEIHPFLYRIETPPPQVGETTWAWLPLEKAAQSGLPAPMARLVGEIQERLGR